LKFKLKSIYSILSIFKNYISYGNTFNYNIFASEFWYSKNITYRFDKSLNQLRYFKRFYYSNSILGIEHSFFIRNTTAEFFNFKPWVFFYNNWIVLVICWFKPPKNKKNSVLKLASKPLLHKNFSKKKFVKLSKNNILPNTYQF